MGAGGHCCLSSGFTLAHITLDGKICLQDSDKLVDLCSGRFISGCNCTADSQLAESESSYKEPCGSFAV